MGWGGVATGNGRDGVVAATSTVPMEVAAALLATRGGLVWSGATGDRGVGGGDGGGGSWQCEIKMLPPGATM